MSTFWRRHKRKLLTAAAVGAAGAAAAYYWWYSSEEQEEHQRKNAALSHLQAQHEASAGYSSSAAAAAGSSGSSAADAAAADGSNGAPSLDDSLAAHFNSIQELSDRQALEELLPRLQELLLLRTDYQPLRDQLRGPGAASMTSQQKLDCWRGLAGHSFARALGSVWLVPLLDLLVRLKLHVVGRHMYLESKLPQFQPLAGMGSGGGALGGLRASPHSPFNRLALPPTLTDKAKEEFFRCDYFIDAGAAGLLVKLRAAVDRGLAAVDFGGTMTPQDVESLVVTMHAAFEDSFMRGEDLWADYLVPPGPAPVSIRTSTGVEALLSPMEAAMVDELNAELRQTLRDYRFVEALRAAVRHTSKGMGAYISSKMGAGPPQQQQQLDGAPGQPQSAAAAAAGGQQRPFPYVVPIVAKSGQLLFEETGRCSKGISGLREVQALCASVFTFGPNIC